MTPKTLLFRIISIAFFSASIFLMAALSDPKETELVWALTIFATISYGFALFSFDKEKG